MHQSPCRRTDVASPHCSLVVTCRCYRYDSVWLAACNQELRFANSSFLQARPSQERRACTVYPATVFCSSPGCARALDASPAAHLESAVLSYLPY